MNYGESMNHRSFSRFVSERIEAISTTLKVLGLAAGYAAFVWLTMYQVENGFSGFTWSSRTTGTATPASSSASSTAGTVAAAGTPSTLAHPAIDSGFARVGGMATVPHPREAR